MPPEADALSDVLRADGAGSRISILVSPRSARDGIGPLADGRLRVRVTAAAVDNAANTAVVRPLADQLGVAKGSVAVQAGQTSRRKRVSTDLPIAELRARLARLLGA